MDCIIEFICYYVKKDTKWLTSDILDGFFEKPLEEVTILLPANKDIDQRILYLESDQERIQFKEDCFCMELNSTLALDPYTLKPGLTWQIEECGFQETFKDFKDDLIKLGLEKFKKANEPSNLPQPTLNDIFKDIFLVQKEITIIRLLTVWSFNTSGSGEDTEFEWNLVGTIDQKDLTNNIKRIDDENEKMINWSLLEEMKQDSNRCGGPNDCENRKFDKTKKDCLECLNEFEGTKNELLG
jgi:hypothetical protein